MPRAATRKRLRAPDADQPGMFPQTMAIFGNRWSAAIVGAAFLGTRRFSDFQARLQAPAPLVADRLKVFCDIGILQAAAHPKRSDWSEYHLTPKALAFFPVVATAIGWAHANYRGADGPALVLTHRPCGQPFVPQLTCDQCAKPLAENNIEVSTRLSDTIKQFGAPG